MEQATTRRRGSDIGAYASALVILLASRLLVISALVFAARYVPASPLAAGESNLPWYQYLLRWDAGWYLQIVRDGYSDSGSDLVQNSINFSPVYPLLCKAAALLFGIPEGAALVLVSNALLVAGALLLFKLVREEYGDDVALYALAALCFFPTSLFFTAGYTESLALTLVAGTFLLLRRGRYVLASGLIGLATGTRLLSLALILPLAWELWRAYSKELKRLAAVGLACLTLATSGVWLYTIYLWAAFGRPQAILTSKRAWHGAGGWEEWLRVITLQPFRHLADVWGVGFLPETLAPWFFLLFVLLLLFFRKLLPAPYTLYAAGALLLPYLMAGGNAGFVSFTRYLLLVFPVFIILGEVFRRRAWLALAALGLSAGLLFLHTALYAQAYWAG
jgi:hypothetical protein